MKEHVQKTGVRKYAGDDLIELQAEPLKALQSFFAEYGNCIVKGCEVSPAGNNLYRVAPGIIAMKGKDCEGADTFKVVPFAGAEDVTLPLYLTLTHTVSERVYGDGKVKPVAYNYTAAATNIQPAEIPFLEITTTGGRRFVDAIRLTEKLDKTGNGRDVSVTFGEATERVNVTSGEKLSVLWGKVQKWFAGLQAVAFTGKAADLEQDGTHRLVTDTEKASWNDKFTRAEVTQKDADTLVAARQYVIDRIAEIIGGSPAALDTLYEIATALNNDPNFATTIMALLNGKADSAHTHTHNQITDFPASLPANGGNADTVDGKHSSSFVQNSGNQKIDGNLILNTEKESLILFSRNGVDSGYIGLSSPSSSNVTIHNYKGVNNIIISDDGKNYSNSKEIATKDDIPSSLPANGGNADTLSGFTAMDLIPEDKSGGILAENTVKNMHGFGYSRNGWATHGSFISFGGVGNMYHTQLQGSYELGDLYFRTYNSDPDQLSFHPWKKVATTEDLETVTNQLKQKADKNHNHDDIYAARNHTHSGAATMKAMYEFTVIGSKIDKFLKKGSDIVTNHVRDSGGRYTIWHNLGHDNYVVILGTGRREGTDLIVKAGLIEQNAACFRVQTSWGDQFHDGGFYATILTF